MSRPPDPPLDALEAFASALARGPHAAPTPPAPTDADSELRADWQDAAGCVRLLAELWPRGPDRGAMPERIGRYELVRPLGRGGFGLVFLTHDPRLGRPVAVKVPRPDVPLTAGLWRRFAREARAAAGLDHPNIVPVYEAGEDGPVPFIAAAYCPGPSLAAWLSRQPHSVAPAVAARLVAALADAVAYAHGRGVTHRDLKPANVLLQPKLEIRSSKSESGNSDFGLPISDFDPKVTDFGLAAFDGAPGDTASGAVLGTPAYMAPEQARGQTVGRAADVYGLGAILYALLTGRPPFRGATDADTLRQVVADDPLAPRRLRPDVPADLDAVCLKCLEKEPARRYPSAAALADDLRRFLAGEPTLARPTGRAGRLVKWARRKPVLAALSGLSATASLALLVVGTVYALHVRRIDRDRQIAEASVRAQKYAMDFLDGVGKWQAGDVVGAAQQLAPYIDADDVRGFECDYVWRELHRQPRIASWPGHHQPVRAIAVSPDGRTVVSRTADGTVRLWDAATGQVRRELSGDWRTFAVVPGGGLVTARTDRARDSCELALWNLADASEKARRAVPFRFGPLAVAPDGSWMVTADDSEKPDSFLRVWDVPSLQERTRFRCDDNDRSAIAVSPDGRFVIDGGRLVIRGGDQNILAARFDVWESPAGRHVATTSMPNATYFLELEIAPHGQTLATFDNQHIVRLWDLATRTCRWLHREPGQAVESPLPKLLSFDPRGRLLATAGDGRTAKVLDPATGTAVRTSPPVKGRIEAVCYAPDGRSIYLGTASDDCGLHRWYPAADPDPVPDLGEEGWGLAFSPDGQTLLVGADNERRTQEGIRLFAADDLTRPPVPIAGHKSLVSAVAYAPDGRWFATASLDNTVSVWDGATHTRVWSRVAHGPRVAPQPGEPDHQGQGVRGLAVAPDGRTLATCGRDGFVKWWDAATGELRATFDGHGGAWANAVAFHPGGGRLVSAGSDGRVVIWDLAAGRAAAEGRSSTKRSSVAVSPDGSVVAGGDNEGVVTVWDATTLVERRTLHGHTAVVFALAYSPDGRTLASGGADGTVKLWSTATGRLLLTLTGHTKPVRALAFRPDGRTLASTGEDGTLRLWRADPPDP